MKAVALGLGSNKKFSGLRPEEILGGAVFELSKILRGVEISSVYRTKAMYVLDQDDFYNMALAGFLDEGISARDLLEKIHEIEASFGRDREKEIRFGPRPLDIDIEFFGNQKISEPDLQIPHPRLKERAFVLIPLLEVLDCLEKKENPTAPSTNAQAAQAASEIISTHAPAPNANAQAAQAATEIISPNATARSTNAQTAQTASEIISTHANVRSTNAQAARAAVKIISTDATARIADAQAARAAREIISTDATAPNANAQAAQAARQKISSNATTRSVDNIKGEIFCFCRDEISAALSSLDEADVEKIISARDFLPFIKSRLRNGTGAR